MARKHKKDPMDDKPELEKTGADPNLADLHQRDMRNSATPLHRPVIQWVDVAAARESGDLDPEPDLDPVEEQGDGDFAVEATEYIEAQEEDFKEMDEARDERGEHIEEVREDQGKMHGGAMKHKTPDSPARDDKSPEYDHDVGKPHLKNRK